MLCRLRRRRGREGNSTWKEWGAENRATKLLRN
jgi:hypothetical protein